MVCPLRDGAEIVIDTRSRVMWYRANRAWAHVEKTVLDMRREIEGRFSGVGIRCENVEHDKERHWFAWRRHRVDHGSSLWLELLMASLFSVRGHP